MLEMNTAIRSFWRGLYKGVVDDAIRVHHMGKHLSNIFRESTSVALGRDLQQLCNGRKQNSFVARQGFCNIHQAQFRKSVENWIANLKQNERREIIQKGSKASSTSPE